MALPLLAPTVRRRMDPRDTLDIYPVLLQGDVLRDILQTGETVTHFSVSLTPEAAAAGLMIGVGYDAPRYENLVFAIQLKVDPAMRGNAIFNGEGVVLGIEIEFRTDLEDREKQYTVGVRVVNK